MKTQVSQMINNNGNPAANQFILTNAKCKVFQSYETLIAKINHKDGVITLDKDALNYSRTTSKHLFIFLGLNRKEIEQRIKNKTIKLKNLN